MTRIHLRSILSVAAFAVLLVGCASKPKPTAAEIRAQADAKIALEARARAYI